MLRSVKMKTGLIVALVLCVAAAAFFDPVKAQEQDGTEQSGDGERWSAGVVEPLTRDLQQVKGANGADAKTVDPTGTELEKAHAEGMMRTLKAPVNHGSRLLKGWSYPARGGDYPFHGDGDYPFHGDGDYPKFAVKGSKTGHSKHRYHSYKKPSGRLLLSGH